MAEEPPFRFVGPDGSPWEPGSSLARLTMTLRPVVDDEDGGVRMKLDGEFRPTAKPVVASGRMGEEEERVFRKGWRAQVFEIAARSALEELEVKAREFQREADECVVGRLDRVPVPHPEPGMPAYAMELSMWRHVARNRGRVAWTAAGAGLVWKGLPSWTGRFFPSPKLMSELAMSWGVPFACAAVWPLVAWAGVPGGWVPLAAVCFAWVWGRSLWWRR